ncbi:MAG: right-handed parallel beta-helix repeat-containing protein [Verrucomicrobia bacterium]|nr:right-handed parallel beta-helix repeat-containing protein [Verrucomicrobiota bacterium]
MQSSSFARLPLLLAACICACLSAASAATTVTGDVNNDGVVNTDDITLAQRFSVGLGTPTPEQAAAADLNRDGVLNAADIVLLSRVAEGLPIGTYVLGNLTGNTVWSLANSPYHVVGDVTVSAGVSLTIEPGTRVEFEGYFKLQIDGTLVAEGTPGNPIVFTSSKATPTRGDWQGLKFRSTRWDSSLRNAVVEYAQTGVECVGASRWRTLFRGLPGNGNHQVIVENGSTRLGVYDNESGGGFRTCGFDLRSIGKGWHHIAAVGTGGVTKIYIDGVFVGNSDRQSLTDIHAIGNYQGGGQPFARNIDEACVYQRALDAAEISQIFRADLGGGTAGLPAGIAAYYSFDRVSGTSILNGGSLPGKDGTLTGSASIIAGGVEGNALAINDVDGVLLIDPADGKGVDLSGGEWTSAAWFNGLYDSGPAISGTTIRHCGQTGIACYDCSPSILNNIVQNCGGNGVYLERSSPLIKDNTIADNGVDGIGFRDLSHPRILDNTISNNSHDGIAFSNDFRSDDRNSHPVSHGNSISGNGNYAVNAMGYYHASEVLIDARNNWWGTADQPRIEQSIYDYYDNRSNSPFVSFVPFLSAPGGPAVAGTFVGGTLPADSAWTLSQSLYTIVEDVIIPAGSVLRIEPGVCVKFAGLFQIKVDGTLIATGTPSQVITFTSGRTNPATADWRCLYFTDTSDDSLCAVSYALIQHADCGIVCEKASPLISHSTIRYNNHGVQVRYGGTPSILDNVLTANGGYGIWVFGTWNDGDNPAPVIHGNVIFNNGSYELCTQNFFNPAGSTIDATGNWWGTTDMNQIEWEIYHYPDNPSGNPTVLYDPVLSKGSQLAVYGLSDDPDPFSPNGDGRREGLGIHAKVTAESDVTVTLKNAAGAAVRVFTQHTPEPIEVGWDGKDGNGAVVADGVYTYEIVAVNSANGQAAPMVSGTVELDTVIDQVELTAPVAAAVLTGSVAIQGLAGDWHWPGAGWGNKAVVLYGRGAHPTSWQMIWQSYYFEGPIGRDLYGQVPTLCAWDTTVLPNDAYVLRFEARDGADNWRSHDVPVTVSDPGPNIANLSITPNPFSPDESGTWIDLTTGEVFNDPGPNRILDDIAVIKFNLSGRGYTEVVAVDAQANVVRTLLAGAASGLMTINWDGRNQNGQFVDNGLYTIKVLTGGGQKEASLPVTVDKKPFIVNYSAAPSPFSPDGDGVNDTTTIHFGITDDSLVNVEVLTTTDVLVKTLMNNVPLTKGQYTSVWDGINDLGQLAHEGHYKVRIRGTAQTGQVGDPVEIPVSLLYISQITASAAANPHDSQPATISYSLSAPAVLTIQILNAAGEVVRSLFADQNRGAGSHQESWDGKDDTGTAVPDGPYSFRILDSISGAPMVVYDPSGTEGSVISQNGTMSVSTFDPMQNQPCVITYSLSRAANVTIRVRGTRFYSPVLKVIRYLEPESAGEHTAYWDGRDEAGNLLGVQTYTFGLYAYALADNTIVVTGGRPEIKDIAVTPLAVTPLDNPYSSSPNAATLSYTLTSPADMTLNIYDSDGNLKRTIEAAAQAAGAGSMAWDCKDDDGFAVPDGYYRMDIQASANGTYSIVRNAHVQIKY